ncbi:MAG: invasion associated locus B family protein [Parvularculales bacterium]
MSPTKIRRRVIEQGRLWLMLSATFLVFGFMISPVAAEPELVNTFQDWKVYVDGEAGNKICYALSEPIDMRPARVNRGEVALMVANRPAEGVRNEVSVRAGYIYKKTSRPYASVGNKSYQLFTGVRDGGERAHWAWVQDLKVEKNLITAMKKGSSLTVKGTSSRGTLTTDRYSLSGISRAIAAIDDACR